MRGGRLVDERRHMERLAALAVGAAHRHADVAGGARRGAARGRRGATACARASSICRSPAAWRAATTRFRRPAPRRASSSPRAISISPTPRSWPPTASRSSRCRRTAGSGSTSSRCRCCPTCWPSRRRASRAPARPGSSTDGRVTEGSSTNAWIVTRDGKVVTRQADHAILQGITRTSCSTCIAAQGLKLEERAFTVDEAMRRARRSSPRRARSCMPVVRIDGRPVGNGAPGLVASALRRDFHRYAETA